MDELIEIAEERSLTLADIGLVDADEDEVKAFCDSFARRLVQRYLVNDLSWAQADAAANNYYQLMICHCGRIMPRYAWDIFLAFDEGEIDERADTFTRPRVLELQAAYGIA